MQIDRTRTDDAKARTMSRRTARKMKRAHTLATLFLVTMFPAPSSPFVAR